MLDRTCSVDGCDKPPRSGSAELCKMHYHRLYRHGDVNTMAYVNGVSASLGRRYKTTYLPQHPLAGVYGQVYVHRKVLYDLLGAGLHPCHWCGQLLPWKAERRGKMLQVDHLNGDGADNRPENLVPACARCNSGRASRNKEAALRAAGWWSNHDTQSRLKSRQLRNNAA